MPVAVNSNCFTLGSSAATLAALTYMKSQKASMLCKFLNSANNYFFSHEIEILINFRKNIL